MNKTVKMIAVLVAVLLVMATFCSFEFVAEHTHHECTGRECPVCAQLEAAVSMLRNVSGAVLVTSFISLIYVSAKVYAISCETVCIKDTLIELKQELLN